MTGMAEILAAEDAAISLIEKKIGTKIPQEAWFGDSADEALRIETNPKGWLKSLKADKVDAFLATHCKNGYDSDSIKTQILSSWEDVNNYRQLLLKGLSKLDLDVWSQAHYDAKSSWDDMVTALVLANENRGTAYQEFPKFNLAVVLTANEFRKGLRSIVRAMAKKGKKKRTMDEVMDEVMDDDAFSLLDMGASKKRKKNPVAVLDESEVTHRRQHILHLFLISSPSHT